MKKINAVAYGAWPNQIKASQAGVHITVFLTFLGPRFTWESLLTIHVETWILLESRPSPLSSSLPAKTSARRVPGCYPPKKLHAGFNPGTPFCLICTIKSELKFISDLYHQYVSRGRYALFSGGRGWHLLDCMKLFVWQTLAHVTNFHWFERKKESRRKQHTQVDGVIQSLLPIYVYIQVHIYIYTHTICKIHMHRWKRIQPSTSLLPSFLTCM